MQKDKKDNYEQFKCNNLPILTVLTQKEPYTVKVHKIINDEVNNQLKKIILEIVVALNNNASKHNNKIIDEKDFCDIMNGNIIFEKMMLGTLMSLCDISKINNDDDLLNTTIDLYDNQNFITKEIQIKFDEK